MKDKRREFLDLIVPDREEEWSKVSEVRKEKSFSDMIVSFDHEKEKIETGPIRSDTVFHPLFEKI